MAALMLMGCGSSAGRIRFGAAGLGGMYQAFGDAFAKLTEEGEGTDPIEVRTTAGSAANIRLLSEDYVQMAIAQADMAEDMQEPAYLQMGNPIQTSVPWQDFIRKPARLQSA